MDTEQAPLSDASAEDADATLSEEDWRADYERYFRPKREEPRKPNEFCRLDWQEINGIDNIQTAQRELDGLVRDGILSRRYGTHRGHRMWLYRFVK